MPGIGRCRELLADVHEQRRPPDRRDLRGRCQLRRQCLGSGAACGQRGEHDDADHERRAGSIALRAGDHGAVHRRGEFAGRGYTGRRCDRHLSGWGQLFRTGGGG